MQSPLKIFKETHNTFEGEESDEKVILLLRRHPFVIIIRLFVYFLVALAPIAAYIIFGDTISAHNFSPYFLFLSAVWCLLLWQAVFYSLTMYTLDVWIVTNKRIIDSTQRGFFNRTVSELHLQRIQDISVNTTGVIPTFLHFGNLLIQTAGTEERFKFMEIPMPENVKDRIMELASKHHSL